MEWSVFVEFAGATEKVKAKKVHELVEALNEWGGLLESGGAVASFLANRYSVRLDVKADDPLEAQNQAIELIRQAAERVGLPLWPVVEVEAITVEDLIGENERPTSSDLVGVSEVAEMLDVSKQRVSELARSRHFPKPVATLASGPVWAQPAILSFARTWSRKPGPRSAKR